MVAAGKTIFIYNFLYIMKLILAHWYQVWNCYYMEAKVYLFERKSIDSQPAIKCSKLTITTLEEGVKYVQC